MITATTHSNPGPTGTLTATISESSGISEGQSITYTIDTQNIPDGTVLSWHNTGTTTSSDFIEEVASGTFIVNNDVGTVTLSIVSDMITEGPETIVFSVVHSTAGELDSMSHNVIDSSIEPAPITFEMTSTTQEYCNGGASELTYTNLQGGNPPYSFAWTGTGGFTNNNETIYVGAGTYYLTVSDTTVPEYYERSSKTGPAVQVESIDETQFTYSIQGTVRVGEEWSVYLNFTSGNAPYIIQLYEEGVTESISNTTTGFDGNMIDPLVMDDVNKSYWVRVTDSRGCASGLVKVFQGVENLNSITGSGGSTSCNGGSDGSASFNISGGHGNIYVSWNGGPFSTTPVSGTWQKDNLSAGTYSVVFRDEYHQEKELTVSIGQPTAINISASQIISNSFTVSATGGPSSNYTIGITGSNNFTSGSNRKFENLSPDTTYNITVTNNGCSSSINVKTEKALQISSLSSTNQKCIGSNDGTAVVSASGGSGSYSYNWGSYGTNSSVAGLSVGSHNVTVSDTIWGDTVTGSVTISQGAELSYTYTSEPNSLTINLIGDSSFTYVAGTAPNGSSVTTISNTKFKITGLSPGTSYSGIEFVSSLGCSIIVNNVTTSLRKPTYTVFPSGSSGSTSYALGKIIAESGNLCNFHHIVHEIGPCDVDYKIIYRQAKSQYDLPIESDSVLVAAHPNSTKTHMYQLPFINQLGSTTRAWEIRVASQDVTYTEFYNLTGTGDSNPNVKYLIQGTPGAVFSKNAESTHSSITTGFLPEGEKPPGLPAPLYNYMEYDYTVVLSRIYNPNPWPSPFVREVVETRTVETAGDQIFGGLLPGQWYEIRVTDQRGCSVEQMLAAQSIKITEANASSGVIQCHGGSTTAYVQASVDVTGAILEYRVSSPEIGTTPWQSTSQFQLGAGEYTFQVKAHKEGAFLTKDGFNPSIVTKSISLTITEPNEVKIFAGGADAYQQHIITSSGNLGATTIYWTELNSNAWSNSQYTGSQAVLTNLSPGTEYKAYAVDSNGCSSSIISGILTKPCPVNINQSVVATDVGCYGTATGSLSVSHDPQGHTSYQWYDNGSAMPGKTGPTLSGLSYENGKQYTVEITADYACTYTASGSVGQVETSPVTASLGSITSVSAVLTVSGGTGNYAVSVDQSGAVINQTGPGTYSFGKLLPGTLFTVTFGSANLGCTDSISGTTDPIYQYWRTAGALSNWQDWCDHASNGTVPLNYSFYSTSSDGDFMPSIEGTYPTNHQGYQVSPLEPAWYLVSNQAGMDSLDSGLWAARIHSSGYWTEIVALFCEGTSDPDGPRDVGPQF